MKQNLPLITIITPSFNQGQFIEATIQSVLSQTYQNIEYIVIDALSTDNTSDIVDKYKNNITQLIRESDKGQSDAIIKGFKLAKGELVGWINSDDLLYPDCVQKVVDAYVNNPDVVLFYESKIDLISEDGSFIQQLDIPVTDRDRLLRESNTLIQPGSFYKRETLQKTNFFDKTLRYSMDLDLWLRLLNEGECLNINNGPIAAYREWDGTKTSTGSSKLLRERKQLLLKHGANIFDKTIRSINFNLIKSCAKDLLKYK